MTHINFGNVIKEFLTSIKIEELIKRRIFYIIFSGILLLIGTIITNDILMFISISIVLLSNIEYAIRNMYERIAFLIMNATITLFLFGRIIINIMNSGTFALEFPAFVDKHIALTLYLVYLFLFIGFSKDKGNSITYVPANNSELKYIKKALLILFYISCFATILLHVEEFFYVYNNGYLKYYTEYASQLPIFFERLSGLLYLSFFSLLGLRIKVKVLRVPILIFTICILTSFGSGQRGDGMMDLMILICFLFLNDSFQKVENRFFTKKKLVIMIISIPMLMLGLNLIASLRIDDGTSNNRFNNKIESFIYDQGGSVKVIGQGMLNKEYLDRGFKYTFHPIEEWVKFNPLVRRIVSFDKLAPYTEEMGKNSHSFSHVLSYKVLGKGYLDGKGIGNSFVAETFQDFGYLGVIMISFCFGFIISKLRLAMTKNFLVTYYMLMAVKLILYAPRSNTFDFLVFPLYSLNIFILIILSYMTVSNVEIIKNKTKILYKRLVK